VVDRIGSGDAFLGGFIHALRNTNDPQRIIDIATGAGYQKLFVEGDFGNGKF
jgi:2-dehydro-3-deoxygluconokinase